MTGYKCPPKKHQFKPGQSGNPGGHPGHSKEAKALKEMTYRQFISFLQAYGHMSSAELDFALKDPSKTMFEVMFLNIIKAAAKGDVPARNTLLDRLWGRVKEQIEVTAPKPYIIKRSDGSQVELGVSLDEES